MAVIYYLCWNTALVWPYCVSWIDNEHFLSRNLSGLTNGGCPGFDIVYKINKDGTKKAK